jgi:5-methyltetrahydrofolate--homocysteine methyltransferase
VAIDFSEHRWQRVQDEHRKWWAGELDRPLIHLTLKGRDPGRPEPELPAYEFTSYYDPSVSADAIADRWLYDLECRKFVGDAFPNVRPNFGPGVTAAFMGLELLNGAGTVWFHQPHPVELADLRLSLDPDNLWYRRVCDIYRAAADRFSGQALLGMTDLGGNLDVLASFRPSESLLFDLCDEPEIVEKVVWQAHRMWWQYFDDLNRLILPARPGYTCWTPLYSETPYYMLQCDFAAMIGPEMYDRFAKPELVATCRRLTNPFYHLDGVGQLQHLDSLLAIPELKGIQWVPGAGKPGVTHWPEVYRKIRDAGKLIQFFTDQDPLGWRSLDIIAGQLGSAKGIAMVGEASLDEEPQIRAMMDRHGVSFA